mgnify:CR=1 FL=1|jgi:hypothetical protein
MSGNSLFMEILRKVCPDDKQMYLNPALVIMAKYFEPTFVITPQFLMAAIRKIAWNMI